MPDVLTDPLATYQPDMCYCNEMQLSRESAWRRGKGAIKRQLAANEQVAADDDRSTRFARSAVVLVADGSG